MLTVYGIPNCDSVKKTRAWLQGHDVPHVFHDFKRQGVPEALQSWIDQVGWEALLNRQGTTWRRLDEAQRQAVVDAASAKALMLSHSSVIKRPVLVADGKLLWLGHREPELMRWHQAPSAC